ncbi:MAG: hypothetical protein ACHQPI_08410 [Thermoanaerobaculia bacterium]
MKPVPPVRKILTIFLQKFGTCDREPTRTIYTNRATGRIFDLHHEGFDIVIGVWLTSRTRGARGAQGNAPPGERFDVVLEA